MDDISVLTEEAKEKIESYRYLYEHHRQIYDKGFEDEKQLLVRYAAINVEI